jgi:predicted enzyme related to lactoylglutathione lyase
MKIRGTDFVMYQVSDLATAARFYREALGLPQEAYSEEWKWAEFNCGQVTLALHGGVKLPEVITGGRLSLAVEDIHGAYAELKSQGARVQGEPKNYSVCWAMEVLDPDGNTVILHQRADGSCGRDSAVEEPDAAAIIALERAALDRWAKGDPSGFLEISSSDVVYFDPSLERRLDGLEALTRHYEALRGKVHLTRYELLHPKVQFCGQTAVLTFNFVGECESKLDRWNCTEVYRRTPPGWRIIQTHWSLTGPPAL